MLYAKNKKAYFDYEILETHEAGIQLLGHEVKSVKAKNINLKGSYVSIVSEELYLKQAHIGTWKTLSNREVIDNTRPRKILLHKKKIKSFIGKIKEGGFTLLVLTVYSKEGLIKAEVGLAKGKKKHQKRQTLKERTLDREAQKLMKRKY